MYDMQPKLKQIDEVVAAGPYHDDWDSLSQWRAPAWFLEKRLGIFMHWGLYSVGAHANEWYSRNMYIQGMPAYEHHIKTFGAQKDFGYKDFIPLFTAEKFDAAEWMRLYRYAGAGYVCPVAEHHDGFQMYRSEISHWNAYEMGPRRDLLGELREAARDAGLTFCTSSHRAEHWWFMSHGREFDSDVRDPMERGDFYWPAQPEPPAEDLYSKPYPTQEYLQDWLVRTAEIIDNYRPAFLYFDWWIQHEAFKPYLKKLVAYYYNRGAQWGEPVAVCYKHDALSFGTGIVEVERGAFAEPKAYPWQTDTAVAHNSWCYTDDLNYKDSRDIIDMLVNVVSKGGNLLLNVGPKPDGTLPEGDQRILRELGDWMAVNGEAIHGSRVWRVAKEGPTQDVEGQFSDGAKKEYTPEDIRFTAGHGCIYAFLLRYPEDGRVVIRSLKDAADQNRPEFHGIIRRVRALGSDEEIQYSVDGEGLKFQTGFLRYDGRPVVIKIETA